MMKRVGALAAKEFQVGPKSRSYGLCSQARARLREKVKGAKRDSKRSIGGQGRHDLVAAVRATQKLL